MPRRYLVYPLDRVKKTRRVGGVMRKYRKLFEGRGWQRKSGIDR